MAIVIRTNIPSMQAQKNLQKSSAALNASFDRLSSGLRIVTAADDAAGLAISESMSTQIRSFTIAERNAQDAVSMVQTAEGALAEVHSIMGRLRELAMQAANGSYTSTDRGFLDTEYQALKAEIGRIQQSAKFNGKELLANDVSTIQFQIGLNNTSSDQLQLSFGGVGLTAIVTSTNLIAGSSITAALAALSTIDQTLTVVSTQRAKYGATMNRLDITISSIETMRLNLSAANSRIRDVDVASETAALARNQVLSQAGVSVLSQANQIPQLALNLLQ
ncbi:MAG TPA: flagellin [Polyangiaceae bacterium]|nr:flagellin [Polyangiaceae bacterium]